MGPLPRVSGLGEVTRKPAILSMWQASSHGPDPLANPPLRSCPWFDLATLQWPIVVMDPVDVEGGARANFESSTIPAEHRMLVVSLDDALEKEGKPSL